MKNIKLFIYTLIILTTLLCYSIGAKTNFDFKVNKNQVEAFVQVREVVRWWPKTEYKYVPRQVWSISFPIVNDNFKLFGPTEEINKKIYFAYESFVLEFDTKKKKFVNRYHFLGKITKFSIKDDYFLIKIFDGDEELTDKEKLLKVPVKSLKDYSNIILLTNRDQKLINYKIQEAENVSKSLKGLKIIDLMSGKYSVELLENLKEEYLSIVEGDLTNPWYYVYLGLINQKLGKDKHAEIYYQKAINIKNIPFYDYFQLSAFFEFIDNKRLSFITYERALYDFFERGYSPKQLSSLENILDLSIWSKEIIKKILSLDDSTRLLKIIERYNKSSDFKEGKQTILNSFSNYLTSKGLLQEARKWRLKANSHNGFLFKGDISYIITDISLNLFTACMITFFVFLLVIVVSKFRAMYNQYKIIGKNAKLSRLIFRRHLSGNYLASLIILFFVSLVSLGVFKNSISFIYDYLNKPVTIESGTWGNYSTVSYFSKKYKENKNFAIFFAIASHQLKDYKTAIEIYEELNTKVSHNNLGVIYYYKNDKSEAIKEFKKALAIDKNFLEAQYNLSLLDQNFRFSTLDEKIITHKTYSESTLILALPSEKDYKKAYYNSFGISSLSANNINSVKVFFNKFDFKNIYLFKFNVLLFGLFKLTLFIMIVSLLFPRVKVKSMDSSYLRRVFAFFIPGISNSWKLMGPLVLCFWIFSGITVLFYNKNPLIENMSSVGFLTTFSQPDLFFTDKKEYLFPYLYETTFVCLIAFIVIWFTNFFLVFLSKRYQKI